jgi:hypothetical protein
VTSSDAAMALQGIILYRLTRQSPQAGDRLVSRRVPSLDSAIVPSSEDAF